MFFKKKVKVEEKTPVAAEYCCADESNLYECNIVATIKELKKQKEVLGNKDLKQILFDNIREILSSALSKECHHENLFVYDLFDLLNYAKYQKDEKFYYEKMLAKIGKEIDNYLTDEYNRLNIDSLIEENMKKLGLK